MMANNNPVKRKKKNVEKIKYYFSDIDYVRSLLNDELALAELDLIEIELDLFSYVNAHNFNSKLEYDLEYRKLFDMAIKLKNKVKREREKANEKV